MHTNTRHLPNVGLMLSHRLWRRPNIETTLGQCQCPRSLGSQLSQHICITFIQSRISVEDAGPTLYKCYTNVL